MYMYSVHVCLFKYIVYTCTYHLIKMNTYMYLPSVLLVLFGVMYNVKAL